MKQLRITAFFISLFIMGLVVGANAQTSVKKDANGNYTAVKSIRDSVTATNTGKTFTDSKGNVYPVMMSKNGKLFIVRTSKAGNQYNQYLKLED